MTAQSVVVREPAAAVSPPFPRSVRPWLWMSVAAAALAAAGNIVALARIDDIYGRETSAFVHQAIAQDVINLAIVCPAIVGFAVLARRDSLRAFLAWLGALSFVVYNYVIYTMSIHVGPLFLVWVAVLGLALYALIGGLASLDVRSVKDSFTAAPRRTAGWFLIVVAGLFAGLWLKDIVPAVMSGQVPTGARELGLPASPVHVLDLAVYLPAALAAGVLLLRNRAWGYVTAPVLLIFLALTGLPILLTPFVAAGRGEPAGWAVLPPLAVVTIASVVLAVRLAAAVRTRHGAKTTATGDVSA